jgi:hypothetical protein
MKIVFKFLILMIDLVLALNTALAQEPAIIGDSIFSKVRLEYFQSEGDRQLDIIYLSPDTHETVNMTFKMMYFK